MAVELLLSQVTGISKKHDLINQKTGGLFNVFEITDVARDEVSICRVLFELLNPNGSHYQGDTYLRLFVKYVLKLDFTEKEFSSAKVYREYVLDSSRRIDLVIQTIDRLIPIEVKIYAGDQSRQCYDYHQKAINSNVFYLTLYGSPPSKESAWTLTKNGEGYMEVTQISFATDVLLWVESCLSDTNTIRTAPIREVLQQFATLIRKLTNQMDGDKEMEICDILTASKENMKSAIEIESSLKACKIAMLSKVLNAIERGIGLKKLVNQYDYEYDNGKLINSYYDRRGSSYPGFSYFIKALGNGVDLWLRIEIEYDLYVGFCTPLNNEAQGKQLTEPEIIKNFPKLTPRTENWWISWEFLPDGDNETSPNFKALDDAYLELFDENRFDSFIARCVENINELLKMI